MQSLEIISVNLWQIVISLCNLAILALIIKKFLYKPAKAVMDQRQTAIDNMYADAEDARRSAQADQAEWQSRMAHADEEAGALIKQAQAEATRGSDAIIAEAKSRAEGIVRQAETEAEAERKKVAAEVRGEIIDVSAAIAEKVLQRQIDDGDQRALIESFLRDFDGANGQ